VVYDERSEEMRWVHIYLTTEEADRQRRRHTLSCNHIEFIEFQGDEEATVYLASGKSLHTKDAQLVINLSMATQ
jgi:hypothetical protein